MGFAKYCEDNIRLTDERKYYRDNRSELGRCYDAQENNRNRTTISIRETVVTTMINHTGNQPVISNPVLQDKSRFKKKISGKLLVCKDCGQIFAFSAGEQKFFEKNHWSDPIRCKDCREKKAVLRVMRGWN